MPYATEQSGHSILVHIDPSTYFSADGTQQARVLAVNESTIFHTIEAVPVDPNAQAQQAQQAQGQSVQQVTFKAAPPDAAKALTADDGSVTYETPPIAFIAAFPD